MIEQSVLLSPTRIFVSYSHKDREQKEQVMTILRALPPGVEVAAWDDNRMLAGDDIDATIFPEIERTDMFLALISRNYLASAYCKEEMKKALRRAEHRGCRVVPVIVRSTELWRDYPIGQKLALPPEGKAPTDWKHEDEHWTAVEKGLVRILNDADKVQPGVVLADTFSQQTDEDIGEYSHTEDWVIRTIDHTAQQGKVVEQVEPDTGDRPDRAYYYFEATPDDWPPALADHTYIELARQIPDSDSFATELRCTDRGSRAIWKALLHKVPGGRDTHSLKQEQLLVLDWINSRRLSVLYVVVNAERDRKRLPVMIEGACAALDALPPFQQGARLILFVACLKTTVKGSLLQRFSRLRSGLKLTQRCCVLPALRPLNSVDIEEWLCGFTLEHERRYCKEKLRNELSGLFNRKKIELQMEKAELPYAVVRCHLVEGGALRRARR